MPQGDWIIDQVEAFSRFLAAMVLKRLPDTVRLTDEQGYVAEEVVLWSKLSGLLHAGEINAAENLLFEKVERGGPAATRGLARHFYAELARMSDDELEARDFSREEIAEGLADIERLRGKQVPEVGGGDG